MGERCFRPEACATGRRRRRRLGCCAPALAFRRACSGGGGAGGDGGTRGGSRHLGRRRALLCRSRGRACLRWAATPSADGRRRTIRSRSRLCCCSLRCRPIRRRPRRRWWILCRSSRGRGGLDATNLLWRGAVLRRVGLRARAAWWCHTEHGRLVRPSCRTFDPWRLARQQQRAISHVAKLGRDARGTRH
jgi:hypothetical protein